MLNYYKYIVGVTGRLKKVLEKKDIQIRFKAIKKIASLFFKRPETSELRNTTGIMISF